MRRLFIVGAKILGLQYLWWAIFTTLQAVSYGGMFSFRDVYGTGRILPMIFYGLALLGYFILAVWFASVLLLRTEWLADKVGLKKDSELAGWPEEKKLLNLGIMLLGFYVLAYAIPEFVKSSLTLFGRLAYMEQLGNGSGSNLLVYHVIPFISDILAVAIGVLMVLISARIIVWLEKLQKKLDYALSENSKPE